MKQRTKETLIALVLVPASTLTVGVVSSRLWNWFVASTFDLPLLTIPVAAGVCLLISLIKMTTVKSIVLEEQFIKLSIWWMALGIGWVLTLF